MKNQLLKVSIISIGDEVRIGQVINTNASWLAEEITKTGAFVANHIIIGDDFDLMLETLKEQLSKNDIVITTGGLGPTHDDITKPVLLKLFDDDYIFSNDVFENIKNLFFMRNREISQRNKDQALIPSKSIPLKNSVGTAPGLMFEFEGKLLFVLPGVPSEMKFIFSDSIFDILQKKIIDEKYKVILYKTLNVVGIFESNLADLIGEPSEFLGNNSSLAFLPSYRGIRLRIGTENDYFNNAEMEINRIKNILYEKAGQYIISENDENVKEIIAKFFVDNNLTIAVAESCTGGWLGKEITSLPGSSQYFVGGIISYSNDVKINNLKVNPETIAKFGAVSKETAEEMSKNCLNIFNSDLAVSITGIAGPDGGSPEKPVGTVWISIASKFSVLTEKYVFGNDREINRDRAVGNAYFQLFKFIKNFKIR